MMIQVYVGSLLLYCCIWDWKQRKIPPVPIGLWSIWGIVWMLFREGSSLLSVISGMAIGFLVLMLAKVTREAIGYGDGILLTVTGIYLGGWENMELFLCGCFLAACLSIVLLVVKKAGRKDSMPFVPFLLVSYIGMVVL